MKKNSEKCPVCDQLLIFIPLSMRCPGCGVIVHKGRIKQWGWGWPMRSDTETVPKGFAQVDIGQREEVSRERSMSRVRDSGRRPND